MTMKKGTEIGIIDAAYNSIRVGDTLKNIHSGLLATVNKYGHFICNITGDSLDRDGRNWVVAELECETAEERSTIPNIPEAPERKEEEKASAEGGGSIHEDKPIDMSALTDQELANELRNRGYEVSATKQVERIVYDTITL